MHLKKNSLYIPFPFCCLVSFVTFFITSEGPMYNFMILGNIFVPFGRYLAQAEVIFRN